LLHLQGIYSKKSRVGCAAIAKARRSAANRRLAEIRAAPFAAKI
jgi:hypothetical protein